MSFADYPYRVRCGVARLLTDKELDRKDAKEAPRPLPKRRHSLSLPRPQRRFFRKTPTKITSQTGSLFKRLPAELRIMIFEFVFGGSETNAVHILNDELADWTPARIRHVQCAQQCNEIYASPGDAICPWCSSTYWRQPYSIHPGLGLLLSCRQAYIEGINLLYTMCTFTFFTPIVFLHFTSVLLSHRLARVKSVRMHWNLGRLSPARHVPRTWAASNALNLRRHYDPHIEIMVSDKMPGLKKLEISVFWKNVKDIEAQDCLWVGLKTCEKFELLKVTVWTSEGALPLSDLGRQLTRPVSHS